MNDLQFSQGCVNLIKLFEGLKLYPYKDSRGIPTIGYGTIRYEDGTAVTMQDSAISYERAAELLLYHLNKYELPDMQQHITVNITQNNLDALGCLVYNIGDGGFDKSTVLKDINAHIGGESLHTAWTAWCKAGGKTLSGLLARREKEYTYFISE